MSSLRTGAAKSNKALMQTISVIGSDKNAGKTTVLNYIRQQWQRQKIRFCTSSIGINGESFDNYESTLKPNISLFPEECFITATRHTAHLNGKIQILDVFSPPLFSQDYILGKCKIPSTIVLEGPNEKKQLLALKTALRQTIRPDKFLIDGSIDRQFIAHPDISDAFFFALLISSRPEQNNKAQGLLQALNIPLCTAEEKKLIYHYSTKEQLSFCLFDAEKLILKSQTPAFISSALKQYCLKHSQNDLLLYLNGALSINLCDFLRPFHKLKIVLHNFTLYQGISTQKKNERILLPHLKILHPLVVKKIFLQQRGSSEQQPSILSHFALDQQQAKQIPCHNIFRD